MPTITLDLSGKKGLIERHQGDLNDTSSKPHLRYMGSEGQYADGIFNPFKRYGYLSPASGSFTTLTGTIAAPINSIQYDSTGDVVYLSEAGQNILKLDGMDDLSLSNYLSITAGDTIKDMLLYEINGKKALFYIIDSNDVVTYTSSTVRTGGMYVGFKALDTSEGMEVLGNNVTDENSGTGQLYWGIRSVAGEDGSGGPYARKLAQQFNTSDFVSSDTPNSGVLSVSGLELLVSREGGTGSGITMKVSIQTAATASSGAFTSRGAWSNAVVNYAINDTVTNGGFTWQCITAHSAAAVAAEEPGVGSVWEDYWNRFGAPSGTDVVSTTFALSSISNYSNYSRDVRLNVLFSSIANLSLNTEYWIVLEESGTNMSGTTDICDWMSSLNGAGLYQRYSKGYSTTGTLWRSLNPNGDTLTANHDDFDFTLICNRKDDWSSSSAYGKFTEDTGQTSFLYLADNGLIYWFIGNNVHTIDGSITGGGIGRVNDNILSFPSYISIADVAETRSRMYIGVQTSNTTSASDPRYYTANKSGIYVWDRRSQVIGGTDFYPTPGAQEIKKLFTSSDGSVKAITISGTGFTEIRVASGNQFKVIQTFERGGYPLRRGVSEINGLSVWLGANGIFYAYGSIAPGEQEALYKIGDMSGQGVVGTSLITGPLFMGNEYVTSPQNSVLFGWQDADPSYNIQKWFPHGEGTIGAVAQTPNTGNVYSKVEYLTSLSIIRDCTIYCIPTTLSDATVIATIKFYKNQSSTPFSTKSVRASEAARGYLAYELNETNVNALQIEIEWANATITGTSEFYPSLAIVNYEQTKTHTSDKG